MCVCVFECNVNVFVCASGVLPGDDRHLPQERHAQTLVLPACPQARHTHMRTQTRRWKLFFWGGGGGGCS